MILEDINPSVSPRVFQAVHGITSRWSAVGATTVPVFRRRVLLGGNAEEAETLE
jgi:hypothetical protein